MGVDDCLTVCSVINSSQVINNYPQGFHMIFIVLGYLSRIFFISSIILDSLASSLSALSIFLVA